MEVAIFKNSQNDKVTFSKDSDFALMSIQGLGGVGVNIESQKSYRQDGVSYEDNTLEPRSITLTIAIVADSLEDMVSKRSKLSRALNPKLGLGTFYYQLGGTTRQIKALAENAPDYIEDERFKEYVQHAIIELFCPNPFLLEDFDISEEVVTWIGGLSFPLRFPTRFAMAGDNIVNIVNSGDVSTPITLEIYGPATNPKITKVLTGEYIKVNTKIRSGEVMKITTAFGNKRVEVDGENCFHKIDLSSTFFSLDIKDNVIQLETEEIDDVFKMSLTYRNRYIGV